MIRGSSSDFIGHPLPKDSISDPHMGPPTTPGPGPPTIKIRRCTRVLKYSAIEICCQVSLNKKIKACLELSTAR